jgi:hypothetical protein
MKAQGDQAMAETNTTQQPLTPEARLELANRLFREYYSRCFWYWDPKVVLTESLIPLVAQGLRNHGGRRAMLAAARLLE